MAPITIIGGGIAGLALGLMLRRHSLPVTILEAFDYPRHRVCGEFLSGPGQGILEQLGLLAPLQQAGLVEASNAWFHLGSRAEWPMELPQPAWALSRFALDATLARVFIERGGTLLPNFPRTNLPRAERAGVVMANGPRVCATAGGWRHVGIKVHATGLALKADLEMHCGSSGYFGLCRLKGGVVNICALLRSREPFHDLSSQWLDRLREIASPALRARLAEAAFVEGTFCATAGMDYRPAPPDATELRVGDASGLIAPITGNGMSLAIETAAVAAPELALYSEGKRDWTTAVASAQEKLRARFARRRKLARALQGMMFSGSPFVTSALAGAPRLRPVTRFLFSKTRS